MGNANNSLAPPAWNDTANTGMGATQGFDPSSLAPDFLSAPFLLGNVGAPFVIGLAVGYFAKKVLRMALFLAGGAIVLLFISEYYGITQVADAQLQHAAETATTMARDYGSALQHRLSQITSKGVSATAGFLVGLKFG